MLQREKFMLVSVVVLLYELHLKNVVKYLSAIESTVSPVLV